MSGNAEDSVLDLVKALHQGNPERVRTMIAAGANIRYVREHGYDALIDAVHGRDVFRDARLIDLFALLVENGVRLSGESTYGESGLRVLSRLGRFDAVRFLLEAGADREHLEWTPLMEAVALGSLADVRRALTSDPDLEEEDFWSRTAWLLALMSGDIAKAELLRDRGANVDASGRGGQPPLFYAIHCHHAGLLRWLLAEGFDTGRRDDYDNSALMEAVESDDRECVQILLAAGADVRGKCGTSALADATSREVINALLDAGADPADAAPRVLLGLPEAGDVDLNEVTADEFLLASTRRAGETNPEVMDLRFWHAMIRSGAPAYTARRQFEPACGDIPDPVWTADRFGQSLTLLPDGRSVQIGGEHEDWYDPDFCIYNDVFVHERDGTVRIYGYPESVFPPTDFHTATLLGPFIYVIGSLGYPGTRLYGHTPVYRFDTQKFRIERIETHGEAPGWIYKHRAMAVSQNEIRVWGGTILRERDGVEASHENLMSFVLDLERRIWSEESMPAGAPEAVH